MYALVQTSGRQFWVQSGDTIQVDHLDQEVGSQVNFDRILMLKSDEVRIGQPIIEGAVVHAEVIDHFRGKKVITFKYYRRKRNRHIRGFRADYTTLKITGIEA